PRRPDARALLRHRWPSPRGRLRVPPRKLHPRHPRAARRRLGDLVARPRRGASARRSGRPRRPEWRARARTHAPRSWALPLGRVARVADDAAGPPERGPPHGLGQATAPPLRRPASGTFDAARRRTTAAGTIAGLRLRPIGEARLAIPA